MSNSEPQEEVSSEEKVSYVERFEKEREDWTQLIRDIAYKFKIVEDLVEVQVDLYSQRQLATDYTHQLSILQAKLKKLYLSEWKKAYDALLLDADYRYNEKEKSRIADDKAAGSKLKMEILQAHMDYFRETVRTIDNMIFGVKHRIEIEDFKRGNK